VVLFRLPYLILSRKGDLKKWPHRGWNVDRANKGPKYHTIRGRVRRIRVIRRIIVGYYIRLIFQLVNVVGRHTMCYRGEEMTGTWMDSGQQVGEREKRKFIVRARETQGKK